MTGRSDGGDWRPIEGLSAAEHHAALQWIAWAAAWHAAYPDLTLRSPRCPMCATLSTIPMLSPAIWPAAFCPNESCSAYTWDPTIDPAELLAKQRTVDLGFIDDEAVEP